MSSRAAAVVADFLDRTLMQKSRPVVIASPSVGNGFETVLFVKQG